MHSLAITREDRTLMVTMSLQELVSHTDHHEHTSGHLLVVDLVEPVVIHSQIVLSL